MAEPLGAAWEEQRAVLGMFIRTQRKLSRMSLRELSRLTRVSNAYLSQIERGLHDPTLHILLQIGNALHISVAEILEAAARASTPDAAKLVEQTRAQSVEAAVRADPDLTTAEKDALLTVYRSYLNSHGRAPEEPDVGKGCR